MAPTTAALSGCITHCQLAHQNGASHVAWWLREGVLEFVCWEVLDQPVGWQALHRTLGPNPTATKTQGKFDRAGSVQNQAANDHGQHQVSFLPHFLVSGSAPGLTAAARGASQTLRVG
jgi:hypothetical protein